MKVLAKFRHLNLRYIVSLCNVKIILYQESDCIRLYSNDKDSTFLDGNYAAFGKVFAGMDAVDSIAEVETNSNDKPLIEQKIKSIRFINIEK